MLNLDQGEIARDRYGRPVLNGTTYTRASTLAKALDDQSALVNWSARQAVLGLAGSEDLIAAVCTTEPGDKRALDGLVAQAKERAATTRGSTLGTAIHTATEALDRGQDLSRLPEKVRRDAQAYRDVLDARGLVPLAAEVFVVCDELQVAGSFDRLIQGPNRVLIGDLKTSANPDSAKWAALAWSIQLAVYAHSKPYMPGVGPVPWAEVGLPEPDQSRGLVIHVQQGAGEAALYTVDLAAGWVAARLADEVLAVRKLKALAVPV